MAEEEKNENISTEPVEINRVDLSKILIDSPITYAERILGSKAIGGSITLPIQMHTTERTECVTTTIPFYMGSDFSIGSFTNDWGDLWNMEFANTFEQFLNAKATYDNEAIVALQSENMTAKTWKGSKYTGFSIDVLFIATRRTINPGKIILELASTALPSTLHNEDKTTAQSFNQIRSWFIDTGIPKTTEFAHFIDDNALKSTFKDHIDKTSKYITDNIKDVGLVAPLYYGLKMDESGKMVPLDNTTVTVKIGDYFAADKLIVNGVNNITFSKEIIAPPAAFGKSPNSIYDNSPRGDDYGYPLWAKCSLSLQPHAMVTKEKFQSWFKFRKSHLFPNPIDAIKNKITSSLGGAAGIVDTYFDL